MKYNIPESFAETYSPYLLPSVHKSLLILSDPHVPYHNVGALSETFDYCQNLKIDSILLNGDFLDCYQLSKFEKDPRNRHLSDELEAGRQLIDVITGAFPSAKIFYKEGNHDERYEKYLKIKAPELLGIEEFKLDNLLQLRAKGVEYIRDQRPVYAGKLPIFHGHELGMKSITVNPARTLFLKAKTSAICSHLHLTSQHTARRIDNHIISTWSTGHLSEEHPRYARNNEWTLGFCKVDFDMDFFEVSNYKIIHGKVYRS